MLTLPYIGMLLADVTWGSDTRHFCRVNVDDNSQTAAKYGVMSIPTLMFFKDGKAVDTVIGAVPEQALQSKIDALL